MSVFIAYQNVTTDGVQVEQASFVADTRETFQPPMYGLRSDYQDLFDYEAEHAALTAQKKAAEASLDKVAIAAAESAQFEKSAEIAIIASRLEAVTKGEEKDKAKISELTEAKEKAGAEFAAIAVELAALRAPVTEIEAKLAALVKPDKVLPFVLLDRIEVHEGRAKIVGGKVLFDDAIDNASAAEAVTSAKVDRAAAVAAITVEVDGLIFDGDEPAQERMARAVLMAESPEEQTEWVLADNTVALVTADQLRRACKLAGKSQTELWVKPYKQVEEVKKEPQTEVPTGSTGYFAS